MQKINCDQLHRVGKARFNLNEHLREQDISFDRIFNVNETALSTVQRPQNMLATKRRKQIRTITNAEPGIHTTVVYSVVNLIGVFIPPALAHIFTRKKLEIGVNR
ncbi:hypothetical protein QE152_g18925 [Popillia japonica]|uniref:Uncharacterized protein n=1 Tax=Popillia japonica TaxID=7064 RepID=A0AAW1L575_POPJA